MARKGENIYKRKDGRWEGRYIKSRSSTGKANYGYVYAKSYREVKAKLISQSSCTSNSVTVDPEISSDQFEQVAMEWFQAICPKVKESTSNKYRNLLSSYILPVFGSKQLRDITHEFIETQCNFFPAGCSRPPASPPRPSRCPLPPGPRPGSCGHGEPPPGPGPPPPEPSGA